MFLTECINRQVAPPNGKTSIQRLMRDPVAHAILSCVDCFITV